MRLGIFGGSFDPVHYGHLILAETCREQCRLDQVWFVPAAVPPHKQREPPTAAKSRVEMLELAVGGHSAFAISGQEIERGGVSYTVDTLTAIQQQVPGAELFLLMGADSLCDLPSWRNPRRICELAIPLVVRRHGTPEVDFELLAELVDAARLAEIRRHQVEAPVIELSSTDLRQRVQDGRSIRFRIPRAVEKYIESNGLYRQSGRTGPG